MNEVQIKLSEEQMTQLGKNIYTIMLTNIKQVRKDTAIDKRYLTKKETCHYLHISNNTLDKWIEQGLPKITIEGVIRFDRQVVDEWLNCFSC
jgi:excisionase family DNA binding protein